MQLWWRLAVMLEALSSVCGIHYTHRVWGHGDVAHWLRACSALAEVPGIQF